MLEVEVVRKFSGRIKNFRLVRQKEGIVLHGEANTYYTKQLAQHAVMKELQERVLANCIEVQDK